MNPISPKEQAQIDKDRQTLKRGAIIAGAGLLGGAALLKYSKGGVRRPAPGYPGGGLNLPAPVPGQPSGRGMKVTKAREVGRMSGPPAAKKPTALDNQLRKGGVKRAVKAVALREERAYGALKPPTPAKLAKVKAADRETYAAMDARARGKKFPANPNVTAGEASMADRAARQKARQDLQKFRNQKHFMTPANRLIEFKSDRDRGDTARDIAVGGGALASGGAAIYAAKKFGKTSDAATAAARTVGDTAARYTPKEIAAAVGAEVKAKTRKTLKSYFPTFIKGGKKVSALLRRSFENPEARIRNQEKMKSFEPPASRVIEFGNGNQVRDPETRRYNDPVAVAAGFQRGYTTTHADGGPKVEDMPLMHAQVIKGAYNKGRKIQRAASRGGALVRDVADTVSGKPRARDAAGRAKKKEWEKGWFREGAKNVAVAGGVLGGAAYLRRNPEKRAALAKNYGKATAWANRKIPDLFKAFQESRGQNPETREFQTPASGLFAKAERSLRKGALGKFMGPGAGQKAALGERERLLARLKAAASKGNDKAAFTANRVKQNVAMKKNAIAGAERRQKDAVRSVKKGAVIAGGGALAGGALMKAHADQPEDRKTHQGARFRNGLIGAAAGSFLGGGLAGGKSGFKGARVGAALGGIAGLVSNPKRRVAIDELQTASFETPASRLIEFDGYAADAGWDIRDPRGKSARVFAPGSRKRERREKEWYEKAGNERKLWKAGLIAAGVAGLAGGAAVGRRFPKPLKVPVKAADNIIRPVFAKRAQ